MDAPTNKDYIDYLKEGMDELKKSNEAVDEELKESKQLVRALNNRIARQNWTIERLRLAIETLKAKQVMRKDTLDNLDIVFDNMPKLKLERPDK